MRKTYIVTITSQFPAFGEVPGEMEIEAKNKSEAIAVARRQMWRDCGSQRGQGRTTYKATEKTDV